MLPSRWEGGLPRVFHRRAVSGYAAPPLRAEILDALAERYALARALPRVGDPDEHAVFAELSRATPPELSSGNTEAGQLFVALEMAYAGAAVQAVTAEVAWLPFAAALRALEAPDAARVGDCAQRSSRLVLRLVGLCVRDYFSLEMGTQVWHHLGGSPELVRVVVSPAPPGQTASDALRLRLAAIASAEGSAEPALPVVRVLRFDPPRGAGVSPIEVEDFPTGLVRAGTARTLADPLPQLWSLRTSRSG